MKNLFSILALTALSLSVTAGAQSKNVYVYSTSGQATAQLAQVKRIEFTADKLVLVPVKGDNLSLDLDKFGFLAFNPVATTGIDTAESASISVSLEGDYLYITAPSAIQSAMVYDMAGRLIGQSMPAALTTSINVAGHGPCIVVVETETSKSILKIAR